MAAFSSQKFNQDTLAAQGERLAQEHYRKLGFHLLATNLFNSRGKRIGEIDFIATFGQAIHFVEVKTRQAGRPSPFGSAREAVDIYKQRKLRKLVYWFLLKHPYYQTFRPQIDVCLVEVSHLDKTQYSVTIILHAVGDDLNG